MRVPHSERATASGHRHARRRPFRRIGLFVLVVLLAGLVVPSALAATFMVNSTGDHGDSDAGDGFCFTGLFVEVGPGLFTSECTLRAAIEEGNALPGADVVEFASTLPTVATVVEIFPATALPFISDPLTIDGYTAPGYDTADPDAKPIINIGGGGLVVPGSGLYVLAGGAGSVLRGLAVHGFDGSGIVVSAGTLTDSNIVIEGCHLGISRGVFYTGNGAYGIEVRASRSVRIGRSCDGNGCTGRRNVIANSGSHGVRIVSSLFVDVVGNLIGTDTFGSSTFVPFGGSTPNAGWGIVIHGGSRNQIGGSASGGGNLVSGNGLGGIHVEASTGNIVTGNSIGTNLAGTGALPNQGPGVELTAGPNYVGLVSTGRGNLISGNASAGVVSEGPNTIANNVVGLRADQSAPLGNGSHGIQIDGSGALVLGNVIGGNDVNGILAFGEGHRIRANRVGTNDFGDDVHNGFNGIVVSGADSVEIGAPGLGNIVGFQKIGIGISLSSAPNFIQGNYVGTDPDGAPMPNSTAGIYVSGSDNVEIGGAGGLDDGAANVIGHNSGSGIFLVSNGPFEEGSRVLGNWIGVRPDLLPAPNAAGGVRVESVGNTIGAALGDPDDSLASSANMIAFNGDAGVRIIDAASKTTVRGNVFFASGAHVPVDLADDGATANDFGDVDTGPNNLQNLPEFDLAQTAFNDVTGDLEVRYRVNTNEGDAAYPLTVDFYLRTEFDGQADAYVGTDTYPAASATLHRSVAITPQPDLEVAGLLVATATDAEGNTSELSRQLVPVPEPAIAWLLASGALVLARLGRRDRADGARSARGPGAARDSTAARQASPLPRPVDARLL